MKNLDVIILKNVSKVFKMGSSFLSDSTSEQNHKLIALDDVSFSVKSGEMLGIIGLNGSGKTTLLRVIAGIYNPTSGSVKIEGKIAPILSIGTSFNNELNARDNIISYGMLLGLSKNEIENKIDKIIEFADLKKFSYVKLGQYSSGMRARLAFSTVLQVEPDILLVDEILAVGDRVFKEKSFEEFLKFKKAGKTIVYTTHNLDKISDLSDRVLLMHGGKMVMIGKSEEVIEKYKEITKGKK